MILTFHIPQHEGRGYVISIAYIVQKNIKELGSPGTEGNFPWENLNYRSIFAVPGSLKSCMTSQFFDILLNFTVPSI